MNAKPVRIFTSAELDAQVASLRRAGGVYEYVAGCVEHDNRPHVREPIDYAALPRTLSPSDIAALERFGVPASALNLKENPMAEMRILTVRQPWAWAIIHGGKDVENRVRNIAGDYRGPVAIHAGLSYDEDAHLWIDEGAGAAAIDAEGEHREPRGAVIGVVDLVGVHRTDDCGTWEEVEPRAWTFTHLCSSWAESIAHHLVLANPRPLAVPIPYRGALGLRRLDDDMTARVLAQIGEDR